MRNDLTAMLSAGAEAEEDARGDTFDGYGYGIAQARYVTRRVFRLVDDEAKKAGLDPLHHQALLQAFGAGPQRLTIGGLAERLDIGSALASRAVKELERRELVARRRNAHDRRMISVEVTGAGRELLQRIDAAAHDHVEHFQSQLTDGQRRAALLILAFYFGLNPSWQLAARTEPVGPASTS